MYILLLYWWQSVGKQIEALRHNDQMNFSSPLGKDLCATVSDTSFTHHLYTPVPRAERNERCGLATGHNDSWGFCLSHGGSRTMITIKHCCCYTEQKVPEEVLKLLLTLQE